MRECGECQACCIYYSIPELGKPMEVRCELASKCGKGCTIHEQPYLPPLCQTYQCMWIEKDSWGTEADRPDRCNSPILTAQDFNSFAENFTRAHERLPITDQEVWEWAGKRGEESGYLKWCDTLK